MDFKPVNTATHRAWEEPTPSLRQARLAQSVSKTFHGL